MTSPQDAIEAVARAIYEDAFKRDDGFPKPPWVERGNSLKQDFARSCAQAAITASKPYIEKALLKRMADWERERCNNSPSEMLADVYARDLGYGDIGE